MKFLWILRNFFHNGNTGLSQNNPQTPFTIASLLRSDTERAGLVAEIVTTQNHVCFLYNHYGSKGYEPSFFLKPRPHVRSQ